MTFDYETPESIGASPVAELILELEAKVQLLKNLNGGEAQGHDLLAAKPPAAAAKRLYSTRRKRDALFGSGLFGEPAWDMLLDLYRARAEETPISVSSLCIASAVPSTTAIRCINLLIERGLVHKRADQRDGRRVFISLTEDAAHKMDMLLGAI